MPNIMIGRFKFISIYYLNTSIFLFQRMVWSCENFGTNFLWSKNVFSIWGDLYLSASIHCQSSNNGSTGGLDNMSTGNAKLSKVLKCHFLSFDLIKENLCNFELYCSNKHRIIERTPKNTYYLFECFCLIFIWW